MNTRLPVLLLVVGLPVGVGVASRQPGNGLPAEGVEAGRRVYIAEGCIHCHSQFIRRGSVDEELWGSPRAPEWSRRQVPALVGNRRQGPDLMNVGLRREREWQRRHLIDPRSVSPGSRMPAYAHLFANGDPRGEALLDYLGSLGREPREEANAVAAPTSAIHDPATPRP